MGIDEKTIAAYMDRFGPPPLGPWHGDEAWQRAGVEIRRALAGERGPLTEDEFPLEGYDDPNILA